MSDGPTLIQSVQRALRLLEVVAEREGRAHAKVGSEAPIFHPQWALRAFMDFEIPQDLCDGYGYPQLTETAKRKILGENLLRLHGMDVEEARTQLGRAPVV